MTPISLDFSQRRELQLHAAIVADVQAAISPLGISALIVGAFARDLHLVYGYGIDTQRQTEDIDFAFAVSDWVAFESLRGRLIDSGTFGAPTSAAHRLRHKSGLPIDIVPFGSVETRDRRIAWPPRGDVVMDVFGFRESAASAHDVLFPGEITARVVSLPALALLKLVCWKDRHYRFPRKDAHDLTLIIRNYLHAGNESRLWNEFIEWTQEPEFDYERAGARMLGRDMQSLLDAEGIGLVTSMLQEQTSSITPARLPAEMIPDEPDRARSLLAAMLVGLSDAQR